MLMVESALKGYAIAADDGTIGTVSDFLFDDQTWQVRWLVADTGGWLTGRKVLIHPSAIGKADYAGQTLSVRLTKAKIENSPDLSRDQPVSSQMQDSLYGYYGWDPVWGGGGYFGGYPATRSSYDSDLAVLDADDADPHLRSMAAVDGYHVQATDGAIGHLENFIINDTTWSIRYLIIDTRNWWVGQRVLVSPYAVREITWSPGEVKIDLSRERIKSSPPWNPADLIEEAYERDLHGHYGWPGYGW